MLDRLDHVAGDGVRIIEGIGHRVVQSVITARGLVPGGDAAGFAQAASAADDGCTMSALIRASATVIVEATLEEGEI